MRSPRMRAALAVGAAALVLVGCSHRIEGSAVSVFADPFKVGGMTAVDGPTGLRDDAIAPTRTVEDTDGGEIDHLGAQSVSDIEQYWAYAYPDNLPGEFRPVEAVSSWDARDYAGGFCGGPTHGLVNAGFCRVNNTIGWDRGVLLPALRRVNGDMAITMVLAHEYGHSIQQQARLVRSTTPVLVGEQQSDCMAGAYTRWVAEDRSPRFTLSTGDGLNDLLVTLLSIRDPVLTELDVEINGVGDEHGTAFERISAFQAGFTDGPSACLAIDAAEIEARRGALPTELQRDQTGDWPVSDESVHAVYEALKILFAPAPPPALSLDANAAAGCADARPSPPASYCPATNTIYLDMPALTAMGTPDIELDPTSLVGDNTAYSVLISRYMLSLQHAQGLPMDTAEAALRTACLTGVATTKLAPGVATPGGHSVKLAAGDIDEAVSGLLTNGLAASDVNGDTVPAGFSRIAAFQAGVLGDWDRCVSRYTG